MTITVLFFASLAETVGVRELELDVPDNARVADAVEVLASRYPKLGDLRHRIAVAVNLSYVDNSHELKHGDELALIPPVSGG